MTARLTAAQITARNRALTHQQARAKARSELEKRGYSVSGNRRGLLIALAPSGREFRIAVNGQIGKAPWLTRIMASVEDLYYMLVYLPSESYPEFFILSKKDQDDRNDRYQQQHPENRNLTGGGFDWEDALEFRDRWDKLPR